MIYTSDQGFFLGDHGWYDKRFIYEESLRMPFVICYPAELGSGEARAEMLTNSDFAPTLLDYAGAAIPDAMQGVSARADAAKVKRPPIGRRARIIVIG